MTDTWDADTRRAVAKVATLLFPDGCDRECFITLYRSAMTLTVEHSRFCANEKPASPSAADRATCSAMSSKRGACVLRGGHGVLHMTMEGEDFRDSPSAAEPEKEDARAECENCLGYGYFTVQGKPTVDRRCRKCLRCCGEGKVP